MNDETLGAMVAQTPQQASGISHSAAHQVIYYDAYSENTSPLLWKEDFLSRFLSTHAHPEVCTFATYASRSVLKRALQSHGFAVPKRKGFMNKRECTLALRFKQSVSLHLD